jgi:hypothetical protein
VQGTARGPSAQGPFARHLGHLRTNGSTVWQGRWAPSSPFETAVLTKISKQNCGDFEFYVFFGLLWKWQTMSVWLASPQYANTYQYLSSLFAEFPIHTTTPYSWWFPCLWWRESDHFLRQPGCFRTTEIFWVPWGPIGFFDQPMGLFIQ